MPQSASIFRPHHRRGFTLIEIMIVVGIIVLLATITVVAGVSVKRVSQKKYTQATLHTLQSLWKDYLEAGNPDIPATAPPLLADTYPASDPTNWVKALRAFKAGTALSGLKIDLDNPNSPTILDGWGNPIRYIPLNPSSNPPNNPNVMINRDINKDGYFFSFGPDGDTTRTFGLPGPASTDDLFSTDPY